ncbi:type VI secretion system membrane subunit TssM [Candidatus Methylocalor cossyra]|uniref:IcmF-related protein n=1 Tax=Candidatus Methylocalor cossyra TaxID=3108543 RepID=A0ABP1C660_9GAMM
MNAIAQAVKNPWLVQAIGVLALALLLEFLGPLVAIAGVAPLASEALRWTAIGVLVVGWVIGRLVAELRAARKDRRFIDALAQPGSEEPNEPKVADERLELLGASFQRALAVLRETRSRRRGDRQYLYELPWYLIIGPPGSGKTTALLNSGLKFPLADRVGREPIRGIGGTRHCDWLFSDEAVLIDTAGRYTTQESDRAVDAAEWGGFLELLKRHRPARPINGVLVAFSVSNLLQQSQDERARHAKAIRQRLKELYEKLAIRFPVYVLFTKCDLVAGFNDFFADLGEEARTQVWGETFPAETPAADPIASFAAAYGELLERLDQRTLARIHGERDLARRARILAFPQQMALLKPAALDFLEAAFAANRYEQRPLLRGVYLTSGTQEGTPIDRLMGLLAAAFRLDRQQAPVYSGRGRSYFLTRLLKEVIFPEAELAGIDPRVERRRRWLQLGAYGAVGALALFLLLAWTLSYQRNRSAIAAAQAALERFRAAPLDTSSLGGNLRTLAPKLDALLAVRDLYRPYGITADFGLSQEGKLGQAGQHAYAAWLKGYFLPINQRWLADRMGGPEAANPEILYQLLRVYLMLGQPERLDPKVAGAWIRSDWERDLVAEPVLLQSLSRHLDHLLQLPLDPLPSDDNLVALVRARLSQVPRAVQLYARFKNEALLDHSHDLALGTTLGPPAEQVFVAADGRAIGALTVPGLYTAWGYTHLFLGNSLEFVKGAVAENWVLGQDTALDPQAVERLHRDVERLYLADYRRAWSDLLGAIRLRRARDVNQTVAMLDLLSRPDSPVRALLQAVEQNTALTKLAPPVPPSGPAQATPDERTQKLLAAARLAGGAGGDDPAAEVEAAFKDLAYLVQGGGDRPAPLDAVLKTLAGVQDSLLQAAGAPPAGDQALKSAAGRVAGSGAPTAQAKAELGRLPEPLKGWFLTLASAGESQTLAQTLAGAKGELNAMLKAGVAAPCRAAFNGRYPFSPGSRSEVTLLDFAKLLAPNGVIDQYFQANLKTFVDVNRPVWAEVAVDRQTLGLSPATLRQFQNAAKIRAAFFPTGGAAPAVAFDLKPLALDDTVATFRLTVDGQEVLYRHGPEQVTHLQWPGPNAGSGARLVFETVDGRQVSRAQEGAWALFRLLDEAVVERMAPEQFRVTFQAEAYSARYELRAASVYNPFGLPELKEFHCPDNL